MEERKVIQQIHVSETSGSIREFTTRVYVGQAYRLASYKGVKKRVSIKAYHIKVKEVTHGEHRAKYSRHLDLGFPTSRSGELAHALRLMKACGTLGEIYLLMKKLAPDFNQAMQKDAVRVIKKQLGMSRQTSPIVRSNKPYKPLPQIELPWDK